MKITKITASIFILVLIFSNCFYSCSSDQDISPRTHKGIVRSFGYKLSDGKNDLFLLARDLYMLKKLDQERYNKKYEFDILVITDGFNWKDYHVSHPLDVSLYDDISGNYHVVTNKIDTSYFSCLYSCTTIK